jgi:hypothetical protein
MLSNVRPGQEKNLLSGALGDPNVNEPTTGGRGRNWTLVALSPSARGAMAFSMGGAQVDLVAEGMVSPELLDGFASSGMEALNLGALRVSSLVDSDKVMEEAGERAASGDIGVALLAPNGLGIGPLPPPASGGEPPQLAYELFSTDPSRQTFIFFDAATGEVVLDSSAP